MSQSSLSHRSYVQLDIEERRQIDRMSQWSISVDEIAAPLGRHRSTIYRELRRNRFTDPQWNDLNGYYAMTANDLAGRRRKRLWKLVRNAELRMAVIDRLKAGWSPEQCKRAENCAPGGAALSRRNRVRPPVALHLSCAKYRNRHRPKPIWFEEQSD
ncbi:helix-turn-helix domain-containing protein [Ahrensia sp. R2A130]|uniref:helix-turn-helix domain-containing protein n=1 Tax=Ahrensia sp. R2A130 TaxID=744979 RepID=UPI000A07442A|nr:helix-turn-helix domain-containing protein [Ahrensia sp. R2A130]